MGRPSSFFLKSRDAHVRTYLRVSDVATVLNSVRVVNPGSLDGTDLPIIAYAVHGAAWLGTKDAPMRERPR